MSGFLSAHGYDPGPTQRPILAGAITGVLATLPAIAILEAFGSLEVEARILGVGVGLTLAVGCVVMALAGSVYARLLGRAANNPGGGWLFGMAYGFVIWSGGAVMILPVVTAGKAPAGFAALGVFVSMIVWGAALGAMLPFIHRPLHESLKNAAGKAGVGPLAAARKKNEPK